VQQAFSTCGAPGGGSADADGPEGAARTYATRALHYHRPVPLLSAPGGSQCFHGLDHGSLPALPASPDRNLSPPLALLAAIARLHTLVYPPISLHRPAWYSVAVVPGKQGW